MSTAQQESTLLRVYDVDLNQKATDVHMLPCRIEYSGPARVSNYFQVEKPVEADSSADPELFQTNFRGRRLLGRYAPVPKGMTGLIVKEGFEFVENDVEQLDDDDDDLANEGGFEQRTLNVNGRFEGISYWSIDAAPSKTDSNVPRWLEFARLAHVMHQTEPL